MKVKDLKELIQLASDDMEVLIPLHDTFDGMFVHPCIAESGVAELGTEYLDKEDTDEMKLLGKQLPTKKSFVLVPHGFFEPHEEIEQRDLN